MTKKWGDETHDKKQNWETRREMGKKWGDGTQDEKKWEMGDKTGDKKNRDTRRETEKNGETRHE